MASSRFYASPVPAKLPEQIRAVVYTSGIKTNQTIQEQMASPEVVRETRDWLRMNKQGSRIALAKHWCNEQPLKDPRGSRDRR
jgi:hypothetical protein